MPIFNDQVRQELIDFLSDKLYFSNGEMYNHYYDEDMYEDEEWYDEVGMECEADDWDHGASKMVLYYNALKDWVVKIPFAGDYYEEEDRYNNFCEANRYLPIAEDDYCAAEAYLTKQATAAGVDFMFACTYYLMTIDGVRVYVAERVRPQSWKIEWQNPDSSAASAADIRSCCQDEFYESHMSETDLALFVDAYGEDAALDLISFISEWRINDIHSGNTMMDNNNHIRIVDYSGFNS